eukprot:226038-Prorocentrum_minimum.AAC.6
MFTYSILHIVLLGFVSEHVLGFSCSQRWGPRPLDLDIIFYGQQKIDTEELEVHQHRPTVTSPRAVAFRIGYWTPIHLPSSIPSANPIADSSQSTPSPSSQVLQHGTSTTQYAPYDALFADLPGPAPQIPGPQLCHRPRFGPGRQAGHPRTLRSFRSCGAAGRSCQQRLVAAPADSRPVEAARRRQPAGGGRHPAGGPPRRRLLRGGQADASHGGA